MDILFYNDMLNTSAFSVPDQSITSSQADSNALPSVDKVGAASVSNSPTPSLTSINVNVSADLIDRFVKDICKTKALAFELKVNRRGLNLAVPLKLGRNYFGLLTAFLQAYSPSNYFCDRVALFFKVCKDVGLIEDCQGINPGFICYPMLCDHNRFNEIIQTIRAQAQAPAFLKKLQARDLNVERRQKSCRSYVQALFKICARLLVIRIDLYYRGANITLEQAQQDRKKFMERVRNPRFKSVVGDIWKLEYGIQRGLHFHLLLFLDGSRFRNHQFLALEFGKVWKEMTAEREGDFHTSNLDSKSYQRRGKLAVGMISHFEHAKRERLLGLVEYLAKSDQYLAFKGRRVTRVMGRGTMPSPRSVQGRPRQQLSA